MATGISTANITSAATITEMVGNQRLDANNVQTVRVPIDAVANQMVGDGPIADEMASIRDEFAAADQAVEAKITTNNLGATQATDAEAIEGIITSHWMSPAANKAALDARVRSLEIVDDPPAPTREAATPWRWAIFDAAARVVLGVARSGYVWARKVVFPTDTTRAGMRPVIPMIEDASGRPLLAADRQSGRVSFALDRRRTDIWVPPEQVRGGWHAFAVRPAGPTGVVATVQDVENVVVDVYQRRDIISDHVVALDDAGIRMTAMIGQSNAGAGSGAAGGPTFTPHAFPAWGLMLESGETSYGDHADSASPYRPPYDLAPYAEPSGYGQAPVGMFLEAHLRFERDAGRRAAPRVCHTSWEGSQPITSFMPGSSGHYNHENLVLAVQRAAQFAAKYQRSFVLDAVVMIQGEAGPYPYASAFGTWLDTVPALYAAAAGQTAAPRILWMQINTGSDQTASSGVEIDQLSVARARISPPFSLVGPMYAYPVSASDHIHLTDLGRMMMGEAIAVAHDRVVRQGAAWHPLWPVSGGVTRSGAVITIPMSLPPGTSALSIDNDWVQSVTNKGFVFSQTGGNSPTISGVTISGTNILVTLDVTPTGTSQRISYAISNDPNTSGWATGRGQIYAADSRKSWANRLGYAVPDHVRHYCVRFSEDIA